MPTGGTGRDAWLVVTAPGMLLTRAVAALLFVAAASLHMLDLAARPLAAVAAGYLAVQAGAALVIVRRAGWTPVALAGALLAVDAALAGLLLGSGAAVREEGVAVAVVAIGLAFTASGARGTLWTGGAVAAVAGAVAWSGLASPPPVTPPDAAPALSVERTFAGTRLPSPRFQPDSSALSVETGFAGTPVRIGAARPYAPILGVERSFDGLAIGPGAPAAPVFMLPSLLLASLALIAGNVVSLRRTRRLQAGAATAGTQQVAC